MAERPACCGGCKESLGVVANDVCSHYLHQRCFNEYAHCQTPSGAPVAALCPVENCRKPIGIALPLPGNCLDTVPIIGENNLLKQLMQEKDVRITTLEHEIRRLIELSITTKAEHETALAALNEEIDDLKQQLANYKHRSAAPANPGPKNEPNDDDGRGSDGGSSLRPKNSGHYYRSGGSNSQNQRKRPYYDNNRKNQGGCSSYSQRTAENRTNSTEEPFAAPKRSSTYDQNSDVRPRSKLEETAAFEDFFKRMASNGLSILNHLPSRVSQHYGCKEVVKYVTVTEYKKTSKSAPLRIFFINGYAFYGDGAAFSILKTALNNEESYLASLHSSMLTGPNRQANDIAECLNYMGKTMSPYVVLSCGFYEMRNISGQEENYKRIRNLLAVLIQNGVKKLILIPTVLGDDENHLQRRRKFRQFLQGEAREINTQYPDVVVKYLSCLEPIFDRSPFGTDGNGNPFIGFKTSLEAILHIMPLLNSRYTNRGG
ncbi:uncharacterized protein LOC135833110 [Planococcus citri]|uniref:uncharacterized protein LOC135833110 n=1 Tax=Planococcus citri TaxID=170843 RepID=UPI0031F7D136